MSPAERSVRRGMAGPTDPAARRQAQTQAQTHAQEQAKKDTYDLDNPRRVEHIRDHGESLHRLEHGPSRRTMMVLPEDARMSLEETLEKILDELDSRENNSLYFSTNSRFVRREAFSHILTPSRVLHIIRKLPCFKHDPDHQRLAQDIYYGSGTSPPSLKLLAILICIDRVGDMREYMDEKFSDKCLPLRLQREHDSGQPGGRLVCHDASHDHRKINGYRRDTIKESFMDWTRRLMGLYIKQQGTLHPHYVFEGDCLPMIKCGSAQSDDGQTPNDPYQQQNGQAGGFGTVYKVKIYDSHSNLGTHRLRNPEGYFALKELISHERSDFKLELKSLLFSADKAGDSEDTHMVKLLATFERLSGDGISTFFLLFDWAQGNLEDFWRCNPQLVGNPRYLPSMAEEFLGLVEALRIVHNDRKNNRGQLPEVKDSQSRSLYGRHGDITPKNLLWFNLTDPDCSKDKPLLVLADFGLGRLHTKISRSRQNPELTAFTATYRCPEFDMKDAFVSRASDIFSLGCVYLEHITWYLLGYEGVKFKFAERRSEPDVWGFEADTFFSLSPEGQPMTKPAVQEWIKELRAMPQCTQYLHQMLDIVLDMLKPRKGDRIKSWKLVRDLTTLRETCQRESSFYEK